MTSMGRILLWEHREDPAARRESQWVWWEQQGRALPMESTVAMANPAFAWFRISACSQLDTESLGRTDMTDGAAGAVEPSPVRTELFRAAEAVREVAVAAAVVPGWAEAPPSAWSTFSPLD